MTPPTPFWHTPQHPDANGSDPVQQTRVGSRQHPGQATGHDAPRDVLYIAARAPRPGFAKSRLGRVIGHEQAVMLYAAFLEDLARRFADAPFTVGWYITPVDAWPELASLVTVRGQHGPVITQPDGDWTERQRALFAGAAARGEQRTVLIASDSPHLGVDAVTAAFARLGQDGAVSRDSLPAGDDLVLGPTDDGGYYLIGMQTAGSPKTRAQAPGTPAAEACRPWDVLSGVRMSTGTVLDELRVRANTLGLRTGLLPSTFDVDEYTDLDRLIPLALHQIDLLATRVALARLGLLIPTDDVAARPTPEPIPTPDSTAAPAAIGGRS